MKVNFTVKRSEINPWSVKISENKPMVSEFKVNILVKVKGIELVSPQRLADTGLTLP